MTSSLLPPRRVPTLTEVVSWPPTEQPTSAPDDELPMQTLPAAQDVPAGPVEPVEPFRPAPAFDEEQMAQRVLAGMQRQIDLMLEYRLRETLTPLLARAADGIVREARAELSAALRDIVERAVAQELARHRPR